VKRNHFWARPTLLLLLAALPALAIASPAGAMKMIP